MLRSLVLAAGFAGLILGMPSFSWAQGDRATAGGSSRLAISVGIDNENWKQTPGWEGVDDAPYVEEGEEPPPPRVRSPGETMPTKDIGIEYKATVTPEEIRIEATAPYLDRLAEGGPIGPLVDLGGFFQTQFPCLDLMVANNSGKTVSFTEALLEVEESQPDPRPLPLLIDDPEFVGGLRMRNDGWSPMKAVQVDYNFVAVDEAPRYDPFKFNLKRETIEQDAELLLTDSLKELGVDLATLAKYVETGEDLEGKSFAPDIMKAMGPVAPKKPLAGVDVYAGPMTLMCGKITYQADQAGGGTKTESVRFLARIPLAPPGGLGAPSYATGQYQAFLKESGKNYQVRVPLTQTVNTGASDHFQITIGAPRSSLHRLTLTLMTAAGEKHALAPVRLSILLPRSTAETLAAAQETAEEGAGDDASAGADEE